MNDETVESLTTYCRENDRVCPQPTLWNDLWNKLPERKQFDAGWIPPLPLILGAWNHTSNLQKMIRLSEHIQWANAHGCLLDVSDFLRGLTENDWHHLKD